MAKSKKIQEAEHLLGIEDRIAQIQSKTITLAQDHASIMAEAGMSKQTQLEADIRANAVAKNQLSMLEGLSKVDALRAMIGEEIAAGSLDQFAIDDKILQIQNETKNLTEGQKVALDGILKSLQSKTEEMTKQDIFGKSEADRLKEINDRTKENTGNLKESLLSAAGISDEIFTMSGAMKVLAAGTIKTGVEAAKLSRELGTGSAITDTISIGVKQAGAQINALRKGFVLSGDEARSVIKDITMLNGSLEDATSMAVTQAGELHVKYGIATGDAALLHKSMKEVTDQTDLGARGMQNQITALAKANGVAPGAVMGEIAENTFEFARFGKDGAKGLVSAAANAKKLGISLGSVVDAGDALLDVQSSIQSEMKAEMMIGRQLNLDALRQAALVGDRDTMIREIARNAGTLGQFTSMNVLQQKALAQSMGVSTAEVLSILQAKEKGVNLDAKSLDAYKANNSELEAGTQAATGLLAVAGGIGSTFLQVMPALGGMTQAFGGMGGIVGKIGGKIKGVFSGKLFGGAAEQTADVSKKLSKMKSPKAGGGMTKFFKSLGKIKTSSMIKAALAIAIVAVALIPAAYAFSLLEGVNPVAMLVFGATMVGLAFALSAMSGAAGPMIMGALAFGIAAIALIPAAYAMSLLGGADPVTMLAFAASIAILGLGLAAMGLLAMPIAIGTLVLFGLSKVLPIVTAGFANLGGVDPAALSGFAFAILPLGIGLAAFGLLAIPIAFGVLALALVSGVLPATVGPLSMLGGVDGAAMLGFAMAILPLGIGLAAFGLLSIPIAFGVLALMLVSAVLPATVGPLSMLGGVDGASMMGFAMAILPLGIGLAAFGLLSIPIAFGVLALMLVSAVLPGVVQPLSMLGGVDGASILGFAKAILPLGIGLAAFGLLLPGIVLGVGALWIASAVLPMAALGLSGLSGIDPEAVMAFAHMLIPLGLGLSALGLMFPLVILGAAALLVIGAGTLMMAKSFALMAGVDPSAIDVLGDGIKSMIKIVNNIGLIQAGKLLIKAAAIAAVGLAVLPFGKAINLAGKGDASGLVTALEGITQIPTAGLISAGFGLAFLAIGMMAFMPAIGLIPVVSEGLSLMAPALALVAPLGEGLMQAGIGIMAFGFGMIPFAIGMMLVAPYIPLLPLFAEALVLMAPPLILIATVAEMMPLMGIGFMFLGYGLIPFSIGMMMLAPYIPLMPMMAEALLIMTPPLIALSEIADILPIMGYGFMILGFGLQGFAVALAMIFPFQTVLPILAQAIIDMAPPLMMMAPIGPQIMYLAMAIGALGVTSALATIPLYTFGAASYFAAPGITLLGEAAKVLGAGLEAIKIPLLAMAAQAPMILFLAGSITSLAGAFALATLPLFAFGAAAWFASFPVVLLASGLTMMVATASGLSAVGTGLSSIAAGLSDISEYKGTLALLMIAAPALALLGAVGMIGGGGSKEETKENDNQELIAKMDELIAVINSKDYEPVLKMDGRLVGKAIAVKKGPKGG